MGVRLCPGLGPRGVQQTDGFPGLGQQALNLLGRGDMSSSLTNIQ